MQPARSLIATLLALAPLAVQAVDAAAQPLSAETMWKIQRIGSPALSPDGRQAVYPVAVYDEEQDTGEADLYAVPTTGGASRRLTSMPGKESEPAWSPDGRWIAFVAKRSEDKVSQLYVIATDGGEATRVGDMPTGVESRLVYFPDENHWILKRQNSIYWYREVRDWLEHYAPASIESKEKM